MQRAKQRSCPLACGRGRAIVLSRPMNAVHAPPAPAHYRADPRATVFSPLGSGIRTAFMIVAAVGTLGFIASVVTFVAAILSNPEHPDARTMQVGVSVFFLTVLLVYAQGFLGMAWIYKAWGWLPADERWSRHWKGWITPDMACFFLLIPYFQYYWMFVVDCGLCDAFDRLRVRYPTTEPAPKTLAIVACVMQIVVPLPVGSILWLLYMSKMERMTREMSAAGAPRGVFGP